MAKSPSASGLEATLPVGGSGLEATLPVGGSGLEATLPAGTSAAPPSAQRSAPDDDYPTLQPVAPEHYVLGDALARGGMGQIRTARDRRLGREVAIKEILATSADLEARFEREARISARLQHPSIISVLEAGRWPSGAPFFAMKLVAGRSLDKVIAAAPDLAARLALLPTVLAVADAMAYAHGQRIIHRDLKPANVLVGDFGEVVVIDWGLAKDLSLGSEPVAAAGPYRSGAGLSGSLDGQTVVGELLGTPAYMPPEQARGEVVDERADVYALGALLFHLLAGQPPLHARSVEAAVARLIEGPLPRLATVQAGVPADLLAVVDKAMAFDAAARYPTARELAADLRRFTTGQLVGAHTYSLRQLLARWVRRHRTAVIVGAVATLALATVGGLSLRRIVRAEQVATAQRQVAVARGADAEDLLGYMLGDLRTKLVPVGQVALLEDVARKAVAYFERAATSGTPVDLGKAATAHGHLGEVLRIKGDLAAATTELRTALALGERQAAAAPGDAASAEALAQRHMQLGEALGDQQQLDDALVAYRAALALLTGPTPTQAGARADAYRGVGDCLRQQQALPAALEAYRAGLASLDGAGTGPATNALRGTLQASIGWALLELGDSAAAVVALRAAEAAFAPALGVMPDDPDLQAQAAIARSALGDALLATGDMAGALTEYRGAQATYQRLSDRDPANARWRYWLAETIASVAAVLEQRDDVAGALVEYRAALGIREALARQDAHNPVWRRDVQVTYDKLGGVLLLTNDLDGAEAAYAAALRLAQATVAQAPTDAQAQRDLAASFFAIGNLRQARGDLAGALQAFRDALPVYDAQLATDPDAAAALDGVVVLRYAIAEVLEQRGDRGASERELQATVPLARRRAAADPDNVSALERWCIGELRLGDAADRRGDRAAALAAYRAALPLSERLAAQAPNDAELAADLAHLRASIARLSRAR